MRHLFNALGIALLCLAVGNSQAFIAREVDSDILLPASMVWDYSNHEYPLEGFQLAQVPSVFPDLVVYFVLHLLTRSDRWAMFLYASAQFAAFVYISGSVVAALASISLAAGAGIILILAAVLVTLGLNGYGNEIFFLFLPVIHSGPFLISILGANIAAKLLIHRSLLLLFGLGAVSSLVFLSDKLLILVFALPIVVAWATVTVMYRLPSRLLGGTCATLAAGLLAGWSTSSHLIISEHRPIVLQELLDRIPPFIASIRAYWTDYPIYSVAALGIPILAFVYFPLLCRTGTESADFWDPRARPEHRVRVFLWVVAVTSIAGSVAFTAGFYLNPMSYRYLDALYVWPLIFLGAILLQNSTTTIVSPVGAIAVGAFFATTNFSEYGISLRFLDWPNSLGACLTRWRQPLGLKAGLSDYWHSRSTMVSVNWSLQINQITPNGQAYRWGNDIYWFVRDFQDPSKVPTYNFIVMDGLIQDAIRERFGAPTREMQCGTSMVWIYNESAGIYDRLVSDEAFLRALR